LAQWVCDTLLRDLGREASIEDVPSGIIPTSSEAEIEDPERGGIHEDAFSATAVDG
jgi:hypothetical protein